MLPLSLALLTPAWADEINLARLGGQVVDTRGAPVADATVLLDGTALELTTDADGRWSARVPPGTYTLKVFAEGTALTRVSGVVVSTDLLDLDVVLKRQQGEEVTVVEADPDRTREEVLLEVRRNAATVSDSLGAESIAKSPDKSASDAVKRVTGISVVGDRYVYVRGMGERYNVTTLNGQAIPSPEPKRRVVPFNILPSNLLRDITIVKTPTPDMDGDTVGGRVELTTKDYPETFTAQVSLSGGWNSLATLQDRATYAGGGLDALGLDDGTRARPAAPAPSYDELLTLSDAELARYVGNWNNTWEPTTATAPPNHGMNAGLGGTWYFGDNQRLGYVVALTYDRSFRHLDEDVVFHTRATGDDGAYTYAPSNTLAQVTDSDNVLWGAIGNLAWRMHPDHELKLKTVATHRAEDEVRAYEEVNDDGERFDATRLRWTEQSVVSAVLEGKHDLARSQLRWDVNHGVARMHEPDRREAIYATANSTVPMDGGEIPLTWFDQSGYRFFNELSDRETGARLDLAHPFTLPTGELKVRVGAKLRDKARDFAAELYAFDVDPTLDDATRAQPPETLFGEASIAAGQVSVSDTTRPDDNYDGLMRVLAGYGMADAQLGERLRLLAGARVERTYQDFVTGAFDPEAPDATPDALVVKQYVDVLPSVNLTWKVGGATNVRVAGFRSIARPDYFELVPFRFTNYYKNVTQTGNPDLDRTRAWNADLRVETFPSATSVFAATVFGKHLTDPIEVIYVSDPGQGQINLEKPYNVPNGRVLGAELEARDDLARLDERLAGVRLGTNLTLVHSVVRFEEADLGSEDAVLQLNDLERPLAGQSPVIVNATLGYGHDGVGFDAQAQLNVTGRRLATVGANGLPSAYEETYHTLDLAVSQRLGAHASLAFKATNLTDSLREHTQEGLTSYATRLGRTVSSTVTGTF